MTRTVAAPKTANADMVPTQMPRIVFSLTVFAFFLFIPMRAHAWGFNGHRIVAKIAYERLEPGVRTKVDRLLGSAGEVSLPAASVWADAALYDHDEKEIYGFSKKFHYVNFSDELPVRYDNIAPACVTNSAQGDLNGCALFAIEGYRSVLESTGADEVARWEALLFITHYVGDIHQPLHAGRAADRGGNLIMVSLPGPLATRYARLLDKKERKWISLHKVWDNILVEQLGEGWESTAERLNDEITDEEVELWTKSSSADWVIESARLAETQAYRGPVDGRKIRASYVSSNERRAEQRLKMAGVRLADMLNRALADS